MLSPYFKQFITMEQKYNMKSPAVKRLMREAKELHEATEDYFAQPVEDNLFEWHFTVRGPSDSDFNGGIYHGRIILPPEYPMKPPSIILLTPNGRFEVNVRICLSISGHHPESWQPSWSIRTALLAIIGFMPSQGLGAIGSLDYTPEERAALAKKSHDWKCTACGPIKNILIRNENMTREVNQEAKDLAAQICFKSEVDRKSESYAEVPHSDLVNGSPFPNDNSKNEPKPVPQTKAGENSTTAPSISEPSTATESAPCHQPRQINVQQDTVHATNIVEANSGNGSSNSSMLTAAAVVILVAIVALVLRRLLML